MAMLLGERTGPGQAQVVSLLEPREDAASAIAGGLVAGEPSGVRPSRSGG